MELGRRALAKEEKILTSKSSFEVAQHLSALGMLRKAQKRTKEIEHRILLNFIQRMIIIAWQVLSFNRISWEQKCNKKLFPDNRAPSPANPRKKMKAFEMGGVKFKMM